jgi:tRNA A-37 threonylcarbamoyl transferase component Bud32
MKDLIHEIFSREFSEIILSVNEIKGLGSVNSVFEVHGRKGKYIIRLNTEEKRLEYKKEHWCISSVRELGIPTPKVLSIGMLENFSFMVQEKVNGINGINYPLTKRRKIWEKLGSYVAIFQQIERIEDEEVEKNEFHKNWKSRLRYNLNELNEEDSLLKMKVFSKVEHKAIRIALSSFESIDFNVGLVHGDLCPRNVIINGDIIYLLDWGTAEINVIPHTEIGILLLSEEASSVEIKYFLKGLGLTPNKYMEIENELKTLNLLHRLDKYRWAEGQGISSIEDYSKKVRITFDNMNKKS